MRKTTLLTCGAALLALVLAGCGSSPAQNAGGNTGSGTSSAGNSAEIGSVSKLASLISDKRTQKQSVHMKMSIESGSQTVTADGDMKFGDQPAMELTMGLPEMATMSMRLVGNVFYIKLPEGLTSGKPWVKIDASGSDPASAMLGAAVEQFKTNGDPAQMLTQLADSGEITGKKTEQLNGQDTTHYSVTVDVKKAVANQKNPDLKKMLDEATTAGLSNFPIEVWVNNDSLPVRVIINSPVNDPTTGKATQAKITVDYTDWGKPVTITAPPASEVGEMPR